MCVFVVCNSTRYWSAKCKCKFVVWRKMKGHIKMRPFIFSFYLISDEIALLYVIVFVCSLLPVVLGDKFFCAL